MKTKSNLIKYSIVIFYLLLISSSLFCQISDYENKLASYMASFKLNAFTDEKRLDIIDKIDELSEQIHIQVKMKNSNDNDYISFLRMEKKIDDFQDYIRGFSNYASKGVTKEAFDKINDLLSIFPKTLEIVCDYASFYEIKIGDFYAIFAYNHLKPKDSFDFLTIEIKYKVKLNGKIMDGGSLNVGGNLVRCIYYKSDNQKFYPTIISATCSKVESAFDKLKKK